MSRAHRFNKAVLALLIAGSLVVLDAHASVHENATADQCALCASHVQPQAAACSSEHFYAVDTFAGDSEPGFTANPLASRPRITPPSRGPPSAS